MNPAVIGILICVSALAAFFAGRGRRGGWLSALSVILIAASGGGLWMIERGPQKVFVHSPISAGTLAWGFSLLLMIGLGCLVGLMIRCVLAFAKKRP